MDEFCDIEMVLSPPGLKSRCGVPKGMGRECGGNEQVLLPVPLHWISVPKGMLSPIRRGMLRERSQKEIPDETGDAVACSRMNLRGEAVNRISPARSCSRKVG